MPALQPAFDAGPVRHLCCRLGRAGQPWGGEAAAAVDPPRRRSRPTWSPAGLACRRRQQSNRFPQWVSVRNRGDTWQPSCEPAPPPSARPPPSKPLLSIAGTTCFCNHALCPLPPPCFGPDARTPRPLVANPPALLILLHLAERLLPAHSLGPSLQRNNPDNELLLKKKGTE